MVERPNEDTEKPVPAEKQTPEKSSSPAHSSQQPTASPPAEERGERLETGKTIARGGKTTGHVPGAMPSK